MLACDWLHCCGPQVYLFDWFKCIAAGYAAPPGAHIHQPLLHHFLRHSCYFSDCGSSGQPRKRRKVSAHPAPAAPAHALAAACVRRAVADDWHRPALSWAVPPPPGAAQPREWPDVVARFDSAALLGSGSWQPFLQATMDNAADHCSTLEIGALRRAAAALEGGRVGYTT